MDIIILNCLLFYVDIYSFWYFSINRNIVVLEALFLYVLFSGLKMIRLPADYEDQTIHFSVSIVCVCVCVVCFGLERSVSNSGSLQLCQPLPTGTDHRRALHILSLPGWEWCVCLCVWRSGWLFRACWMVTVLAASRQLKERKKENRG